MRVPKVKVFGRATYSDIEDNINAFIRQNGIEAEDIISVSFANGEGGYRECAALMVYKAE